MTTTDIPTRLAPTLSRDRTAPERTTAPSATIAEATAVRYLSAAIRLSIGFTFMWAFADKLFGLGKATPSAGAWLDGGSPTTGFLSGVEGPFAGIFNGMAGSAWADWLFMAGLLGVGAALLLGIGIRIAAVSGGLLLVFMWAASLPLDNNPFMDDHLVYALTLGLLALLPAGDTLGFGRPWSRLAIVEQHPFLR
jgi:thiosulfate dehydrogenase [quinone] large subunit